MEGEKNFVHEDENWRQRVRYENQTSRDFTENWGFLTGKKELRDTKYATRLVKYFNPQGGQWTVEVKRIPERTRPSTTGGIMSGTMGGSHDEKLTPGSAMHTVNMTHGGRLREIEGSNPAFRTTYSRMGTRGSLEQFGVCAHGHRSTRTKHISG